MANARTGEGDSVDPVVVGGIAAIVIPSITSHEAMHGFVADRLGDPTARERGRLTLNPLPHIDPFFTILIPGIMLLSGTGVIFGGAKPVPVDVSRLRHPRRDWALVAAAGPLTNLTLALGLSAVLALLVKIGLAAPESRPTEVLSVGIYVNALLAVFNLIPIPPLDGSRLLQFFLSGAALVGYQRLERFGLLLIVALILFFPPAQVFLSTAVRDLTLIVTSPFGVAPAVASGLRGLLQ
jgi:Zn-dependent protease